MDDNGRADLSRWPSRFEVFAELKRRDPARYGKCLNFSYSPGTGDGATVEQIADQIQAVDRSLADPRVNLASRLGGMIFMLEDSCHDQIDTRTTKPVEYEPAEQMRRHIYRECADLMREAETMLREIAAQPLPERSNP